MSVPYYGDFAEDDTVNIPFNTFTSNDPAASSTITDLADADIKVHKDGNDTEIAIDGATVLINFDSITGNHLITIDTSAHADYAVGSEYAVRIEGTTVDGATINAWIGAFSIERAGGVIALLKLIQTAVITNAAGADVATDIKALKAETVLIVEDTNELQGDDIPTSIAALPTAVEIQAEIEENGASVIDTIRDELANGTDGLSALKVLIDELTTQGDTNETKIDTAIAGAVAIKANVNGHIHISASSFIVPAAGSNTYRVEFFHYDSDGNMEAPDSAPTIAVDNQAGTSRNANLDSTTMTLVVAGRYRAVYTVDNAHAIEQLNFVVTCTEGAVAKLYGAAIIASDDQSKVASLYTLLATSHAELAAIPAAGDGIADKIELLFMALKNKFTSTASQQDINNDAESSIGSASISDDGTTLTKGEFS